MASDYVSVDVNESGIDYTELAFASGNLCHLFGGV